MNTSDILSTVEELRLRGVEFLPIPKTYYENLRKSLKRFEVKILEDLEKIEKLGILVDFDSQGYLL